MKKSRTGMDCGIPPAPSRQDKPFAEPASQFFPKLKMRDFAGTVPDR
jgi:hypothetical protein